MRPSTLLGFRDTRPIEAIARVAILLGGALLIAAPFLNWLGVHAHDFDRSYTLSSALERLKEEDLLGPGMSVIPIVVAGSVALLASITGAIRAAGVVAIVIGAAAGAYAAYLHAALEYSTFGAMSPVQTTPGAGLFLAMAGATLVFAGGLLRAVDPHR